MRAEQERPFEAGDVAAPQVDEMAPQSFAGRGGAGAQLAWLYELDGARLVGGIEHAQLEDASCRPAKGAHLSARDRQHRRLGGKGASAEARDDSHVAEGFVSEGVWVRHLEGKAVAHTHGSLHLRPFEAVDRAGRKGAIQHREPREHPRGPKQGEGNPVRGDGAA